MKLSNILFFVAIAGIVLFIVRSMLVGQKIAPKDALARIEAGNSVLIDVREPSEWADGVVKGALLLPLSDLRGPRKQWADALKKNVGKELLLYCRSGGRSGIASAILEKEGFKTVNAGGFTGWAASEAVIVKP